MTAGQLAVGGAALALAAVGFAFGSRVLAPVSKPGEPTKAQGFPYSDPIESRAKLERIGQALVLYRQDFPAKPVSEWSSYRDAGMPFSLLKLTQPGRVWTIAAEDLKLEPGLGSVLGTAPYTDFAVLYRFDSGGGEAYWRRNGTRQIVVMDTLHPGTGPENGLPHGWKRCLVLRWDGTVEEVEFRVSGRGGIAELLDH